MDFLPPCESAASHYRVGLVSFGSGCVLVFQGGVFECSSRMKGNFQVRFLEGRVPAMAPGYSTTGILAKSPHSVSFTAGGPPLPPFSLFQRPPLDLTPPV